MGISFFHFFPCSPEHHADRYQHKHCCDGGLKEGPEIIICIHQPADQIFLNRTSQNKSQNQRRLGKMMLCHKVSDHAENQRSPDIEHAVVRAVGSHDTENQDRRKQDVLQHCQNFMAGYNLLQTVHRFLSPAPLIQAVPAARSSSAVATLSFSVTRYTYCFVSLMLFSSQSSFVSGSSSPRYGT